MIGKFFLEVDSYLNGTKTALDSSILKYSSKNAIESYKINTGIRVAKNIAAYYEGKLGKSDLLVSIRNYLLVMGRSVGVSDQIRELVLLMGDRFGLSISKDNLIEAAMSNPSYINRDFIWKAFMNIGTDDLGPQNNKSYMLETSPYVYNLTGFRQYKSIEQKLCVTGALNCPGGYTCMIALPTGGGKSLVSQTVAYQDKKSLTIVIVPTVSLAIDQARAAENNIRKKGELDILYYYSGMGKDKVDILIEAIESKKAKMLFISPEATIKNKRISEVINEAAKNKYLKNIVIDEAHMVIEWGSFFRMDYQFLETWKKKLTRYNSELRTYLLSATFEKKTVSNLKQIFVSDEKFIEIRCDALRREPRYIYIESKNAVDKEEKYLELVDKLPRPIIIYTLSPDSAEDIKETLAQRGYDNIPTFTGKTTSEKREKIIDGWSKNEFDAIIATSAFGIGVDKSDIRTVLHLYIPENPNKYYQELGRGGRDGLPCLSLMCVNKKEDLKASFSMVDKVLLEDKIVGRWFDMINSPYSERSGGDKVLLDTSIIPSYNIKENEDELYFSKANIQWNIYVILLFRRHGLLSILDMINTDDQRCFIKVSLSDPRLMENSDYSLEKISKIRQLEWDKNEKDFKKIKESIDNYKDICWSEMFTETYDKVSEYCSGCGEHENIVAYDYNKFPLKKRVDRLVFEDQKGLSDLYSGSRELQVNASIDNIELIEKLISLGASTVVLATDSSEHIGGLIESLNPKFNINFIGISEFDNLVKSSSWYWLSGGVILLYGQGDLWNSDKLFLISRKAFFKESFKMLHLIEDIPNHKKILDRIEGPHFESYIITARGD